MNVYSLHNPYEIVQILACSPLQNAIDKIRADKSWRISTC